MSFNILAINLGSTSTKVAYYEEEKCVYKETISHPIEDLKGYANVQDQYQYRMDSVSSFLKSHDIDRNKLSAVVSRGGNTRPLESGIYRINQAMLDELKTGVYGVHPCNIGSPIAYEMYKLTGAVPLIVDSPVTDEFEPLSRLSGQAVLPRASKFHALNQKAIARRLAGDLGKDYDKLNLIVTHMGGGISISAHKQGKMIDANNALEGEGPYSPERSGGLVALAVVNMCFSGKYTKEDMSKFIVGKGGLMSYLGTSDVREIEKMIDDGDKKAEYCLEGMSYQVAKDIGAMAAVLEGNVDAICITGGIANSKRVVEWVRKRVSFIAPVHVYPGEDEMEALALGALRGLRKEQEIKEFK